MANIGSRSTASGSGTSVAPPTAIVHVNVNSLDDSVSNYDWQPLTQVVATEGFSLLEVDSIAPGTPNVLVVEEEGTYQCDLYFGTNVHPIDAVEQWFVGRTADGGTIPQPFSSSQAANMPIGWRLGAESHEIVYVKAGEQWKFGFGADTVATTTNTNFNGTAVLTRLGELPDFL